MLGLTETQWNLIMWISFAIGFFVREIPAIMGKVPWDPLSVVIWDLERYWPVTLIVMILCAWLLAHLVAHFIT